MTHIISVERSLYYILLILILSAVLCCSTHLHPKDDLDDAKQDTTAKNAETNSGKKGGKLQKSPGITHCGGMLNGSHGFFHTPNFPREFPDPISCKWLLYAPPGKKIVLYFTQYYLTISLGISEYEYYKNESFYVGRKDLQGDLDYNGLMYVAIEKPYMLVKFQVNDIHNDIHLRTEDFLMDVFGFNITYEISDVMAPVRQNTCSVAGCAYLGNCLAMADFSTYACHCFGKHYGRYCQYGTYCDPDNRYDGHNMCQHGGKCRYWMGSMVNTCDCPLMYYGMQCEFEKQGYVQWECQELGCSQLCNKKNDTTTVCACHDGFRLMPDGKTCGEKGRWRYAAEVRLDFAAFLETQQPLPENCTSLVENFPATASEFLNNDEQEIQNLTITHHFFEAGYVYIGFAYFGEKTETLEALNPIFALMNFGKVCKVSFDKEYIRFDDQPALHALSIENPSRGPTVEGTMLTVVCRAKGSENTHFQWYKDGWPINVHRSERAMWQARIPSQDGETRTSVLSIERAHYLDEGEYQCEVTDWGETESVSMHVSLHPIPHMDVSPLALTIEEGASSVINCISRDESKRAQYRYNWLLDGQLLQDRPNGEVIEDLQPSGSRLTIREANKPAVYTCQISSASATTKEDCHLHILRGGMQTCQGEISASIRWQTTQANGYDIQRCPRDAEGHLKQFTPCDTRSCRKLTWNTGQVRRQCVCSPSDGAAGCRWAEPSFVRCHSIAIDIIEQKLTRVLLGYEAYDLEEILSELELYQDYQQTMEPLFAGDIDKQAHFIHQLHKYARMFLPQEQMEAVTQELFKLSSRLIDISYHLGPIDQKALSIFYYQGEFMKSLAKDPQLAILAHNRSHTLETYDIKMTVSVVPPLKTKETTASQAAKPKPLQRVRRQSPLQSLPQQSQQQSFVAAHVVRHLERGIIADMHRVKDINENSSVTFITAVYKRMRPFIPQQNKGGDGAFVNSDPLFVDLEAEDMFFPWTTKLPVTMTFKHLKNVSDEGNGSLCAVWNSEVSPSGVWVPDACNIVLSNSTHTTCTCYWPGHYIVLSTTQSSYAKKEEQIQGLIVMHVVHPGLFLAFLLSACLYAVCLILHAVYWTAMKREWRFIRTCFTVVMMGIAVNSLLGLTSLHRQMLCHVSSLVLFFLYECAVSFLFVESLRIYLHNLDFTAFTKSMAYKSKDAMLALGLSSVSITLTIVVGETMGYNQDSKIMCWITVHGWEFFTFTVPAAIILTGYFLLTGLSCVKMKHADKTVEEKTKHAFRFYVLRSVVTCIFLVAQALLSILVASHLPHSTTVLEGLLGFVHVILACIWLLLFRKAHVDYLHSCWNKTPCSKKLPACMAVVTNGFHSLTALCPMHKQPKVFKAFIKASNTSKNCPNILEAEEALKRDEKYTSEIKEQLSCLLGSSSEGSKQSRLSSDIPLRPPRKGSDVAALDEEHPKYCPCKECAKKPKTQIVKPANCPSFIKETPLSRAELLNAAGVGVGGSRAGNRGFFFRSQSVPENSEFEAVCAARRQSKLKTPFPELERGISYISDGQWRTDAVAKSEAGQAGPSGISHASKGRRSSRSACHSVGRSNTKPHHHHHYRSPRPASISSDSSSASNRLRRPQRTTPNSSSPVKPVKRNSDKSTNRNSNSNHSNRRKALLKIHNEAKWSPTRNKLNKVSITSNGTTTGYSDDHSSAVLSDDEMSDESARVHLQLLRQPVSPVSPTQVRFAEDVVDRAAEGEDDYALPSLPQFSNSPAARDDYMNDYLEMSFLNKA